MATYEVEYLYRDAGNYKFRGRFYVSGSLTLEELRPSLFEDEYFVPERIGIPSLVPDLKNDDDHMFHEFESIRIAEKNTCFCSARDFVARVRSIGPFGWL